MSENLSIDEILRQAEEIRKKTAKTAQKAVAEIKNTDKPIETKQENNVADKREKTTTFAAVSEKTAVVKLNDKTSKVSSNTVKENLNNQHISDKTQSVHLDGKTASVPNINSVKKSFFKSDYNNEPVFSKEPPEIIEKPATIKSKSKFIKTSDLQEIPTILAVEELEKTRIMGSTEIETPENKNDDEVEEDAQIRFDGFDDEIEHVAKIDEDAA